MQSRPALPVIEQHEPTKADRARWAKEHQDFIDLHKRLARQEREEAERLEQLDETERLKHTDKAPTALARLFA
jgi:hypothetical protein